MIATPGPVVATSEERGLRPTPWNGRDSRFQVFIEAGKLPFDPASPASLLAFRGTGSGPEGSSSKPPV